MSLYSQRRRTGETSRYSQLLQTLYIHSQLKRKMPQRASLFQVKTSSSLITSQCRNDKMELIPRPLTQS